MIWLASKLKITWSWIKKSWRVILDFAVLVVVAVVGVILSRHMFSSRDDDEDAKARNRTENNDVSTQTADDVFMEETDRMLNEIGEGIPSVDELERRRNNVRNTIDEIKEEF